ncbi:MAG: MBL fold metallo-hydrolase [Candidatus Cloacimonetes bacterium]|nr:MBL fold metallo-hydrolase [Candidatus Cloacimonadota bacterium]
MFQTSVLASGSKGNCILVKSKNHAIIFDAGISVKRILACLESLDVPPSSLVAIILSHEHSDHSRCAGALSRTLKIPLYATNETYNASLSKLRNLHDRIIHFEAGTSFTIENFRIHPFSSSHDAVDSCNFSISCFDHEDRVLGIATDLGYPTRLSTKHLKDSTTLILESNHDVKMLLEGPYDWFLKQRVRSSQGHLSNEQAVGFISQIHHPGLKNLILAHLSEINNTPELAEQCMQGFLNSIRSQLRLLIASQHAHTPLIDV